jgi:threonine/homoserine/homoserine lactone efflux protein
LGGGAFLLWLGARTALAPPAPAAEPGRVTGRAGRFLLGLALTLSNPMTILSFAAMFAGLGVGASGPDGPGSVGMLVGGVFLGSAAWWVTLSGATSLARRGMTPARMRWINRVSGGVVALFGVAAMAAGIGAPR